MKYKTLYADPPWHFDDELDKTRKKPYPTMTLSELKKLPINRIIEDEAHIYLWSTSAHVHEAIHLIEAWGFEYKLIIPWIKLTKKGKLHFGMGHYFRHCMEPCLFGVRGAMPTLTKNTRNILYAKTPGLHSAKPDEMYNLIEKQNPRPRLELFSRNKREDWTMIGDEIDGLDIRKALDNLLGLITGQQTLTKRE